MNRGKWDIQALMNWRYNMGGQNESPETRKLKAEADLKEAKAKQEQAFNTWQNAILKAGNEVSNALLAYNSSAERSVLDQKQVDLYAQNVEDTRLLYKSKGSSYLEVIQAQTNLLNARISKVTDDFSKMQAVVNLYQALGGGSK